MTRRPRATARPPVPALAALAALALAVLAASALPAAAQAVRGRVVSATDGAPLAGAYVTLLDGAGELVARTLTDATGAFTLAGRSPGAFTVRAEYIGYGTVEDRVASHPGAPAVVELRAPQRAIELEGLVAEVDRACRLDPRIAERLTELWDEVAKAFQVTAYVEQEGTFLLGTDLWHRELEPQRLRVVEERRRSRNGFHRGSPFVSMDPERLAEGGYIVGNDQDGHRYFAPDARTLMSRSFRDSHCFGFTDDPPDDGERGWVGIRFTPRDHDRMDVEGTLWIDGGTYEPQRLDFEYSRLPYPVETRAVGGRIDFARIPEGPWIVRRWRIRVPVAQLQRVRLGNESRTRYEAVALLEDGGEVMRVQPAGERRTIVLGNLGRVEGRVRLTTAEPVDQASVTLEGTAFRARTDADGRFVIRGVPEGLYTLAWTSPALDSLHLPGASREVEVGSGDVARVDAVLPPAGVVLAERCTEPLREDGMGLLRGNVTTPEGRVPPGTVVRARWQTVDRIGSYTTTSRTSTVANPRATSTGRNVDVTENDAWADVSADGAWRACGAPHDEEIVLWAEAGSRRSDSTRVRLRRGEIRALTFTLPPAEPGEVTVRVELEDGRTARDAEVAFPDLGLRGETGGDGSAAFPEVPSGRHLLEVRRLGTVTRRDTVEVTAGRPTRVTVPLAEEAIALAPITVEVRRTVEEVRRRVGASAHAILDHQDIEVARREGVHDIADLLVWALPAGVRTGPLNRGVNHVGTCIESSRPSGRTTAASSCEMVTIFVDNARLEGDEAARFAESVQLGDIATFEYVSAQEATFRLGLSTGRGALIVTTRRR